jgi:DNA-binding response OmpR family regulator
MPWLDMAPTPNLNYPGEGQSRRTEMTPSNDTDAPGRRVLIVNSNQDVVDMLRLTFERAGWNVATAHVHDAKEGTVDLVKLAHDHDASVIVFDVAPPYEENWKLLENIRRAPGMEDRAFVLTTTNEQALHKVGGDSDAIEIMGKPYDLAEVLSRAKSLILA